MRINQENLLVVDGDTVTASLGANLELKPIYLGHVANYSIQLFFSGSPVGTLKLQASNDAGSPNSSREAQKYMGVQNWTDIKGSDQAITEAGDHMWQVENTGYIWVRVVYIRDSGTGNIDLANANVKGI